MSSKCGHHDSQFVYQNVFTPEDSILVMREQLNAVYEQVIKIKRIVFFKNLLIADINFRQDALNTLRLLLVGYSSRRHSIRQPFQLFFRCFHFLKVCGSGVTFGLRFGDDRCCRRFREDNIILNHIVFVRLHEFIDQLFTGIAGKIRGINRR